MCKACGDISEDIAADSLHEAAAARHCLTEQGYGDIGLDVCHSAADINSHRIGDDHILAGDDAAYGHTLSCVGVGHKCYPLMCEGELRKVLRLGETLLAHSLCIRLPYLYGEHFFILHVMYEHFLHFFPLA